MSSRKEGKRPISKKMGKQDPSHTEASKPPPTESEEQKEEAPKAIEQGFGRFEYRNGTIYEGQWKILNGVKMKDGEGTLLHSGQQNQAGCEEYTGSWVQDKMEGYGVYKYTSGAVYSGEWRNNKQEGRGVYEFADGAIYDGEWKEHKMNGEGQFIDRKGQKWEGEFVDGVYQSKMQKYLKTEKMLKKKEADVMVNVMKFFEKFRNAFEISDKKTFKENLMPFFAVSEEIKQFVKDYDQPFPKYEERLPDKWNEAIQHFARDAEILILRQNMQSRLIEPSNILSLQLSGLGQIVEFVKTSPIAPDKKHSLALCNISENQWIIVFYSETKII